jgi:3-deoxy-manno-octulosonate cytidylyltransferase (CMP-KDO synthetase)
MILHVLHRAKLSDALNEVYVATDSDEIRCVVESHGGKVIMTSAEHQTGSDRLAEAVQDIPCDIVVNIQGDEALLDPAHVSAAVSALLGAPECQAGLLVTPFARTHSPSDIKVVLNCRDEVMYLSRQDIPSDARTPGREMLKAYHVVPFRRAFLLEYTRLPKTPLETIEFNEYLRILEHGHRIKAARVVSECISVDTPADLDIVRGRMPSDPIWGLYRGKATV